MVLAQKFCIALFLRIRSQYLYSPAHSGPGSETRTGGLGAEHHERHGSGRGTGGGVSSGDDVMHSI